MGSDVPPHFLDADDFQRPRQPTEFVVWVTATLERLGTTREGKSVLRRGLGLAKQLVEELHPLSILVDELYADRHRMTCQPVLGNQNYDAVLTDMSVSPPNVHKIEITQASTDYESHLRMLLVEDRGWAPMLGSICRRAGAVIAEAAAASEHALVDKMLAEIVAAARRKSDKQYGKDTSLLIVCEDSAFKPEFDLARLQEVTANQILTMNLDFRSLHVVGGRRRLFRSFEIV